MQLGGNAPLQEFLLSYEPREQGGYSSDLSIHDKYHCWAATQYREKVNSSIWSRIVIHLPPLQSPLTIKLTAGLEGRSWAPSAPPSNPASSLSTPDRPNSSQSLRKARASGRSNTLDLQSSPSNLEDSIETASNQKAANETFFESLGAVSFRQLYRIAGLALTTMCDRSGSHRLMHPAQPISHHRRVVAMLVSEALPPPRLPLILLSGSRPLPHLVCRICKLILLLHLGKGGPYSPLRLQAPHVLLVLQSSNRQWSEFQILRFALESHNTLQIVQRAQTHGAKVNWELMWDPWWKT